jgi:polyferredoxin
MKLDAAPWSAEKLARKGAKHLLWAVFALWTGFTFVGFFTPIHELGARAADLDWGGWENFWVLFYALATWGNAGFLREQVCKYMCPYARFQSAMFDRNTLIIAYDAMRGEPRGARKRGTLGSVLARARGLLDKATAYDYVFRASQHPTAASAQAHAHGTITFDWRTRAEPLPDFTPDERGDCVDCTLCVQVCPTGIDIRNGLQYECIACGACIDSCDTVMDKVGYPQGLIRYTTQHAIDARPTHILRPRIVVYGTILVALFVAWVWGVTHRSSYIAEVLRDRNALYRVLADGGVENSYQLKIVNKRDVARDFVITIDDAHEGLVLGEGPVRVTAPAGEVIAVPLTVHGPATLKGRHRLEFETTPADGGRRQETHSIFFGPAP